MAEVKDFRKYVDNAKSQLDMVKSTISKTTTDLEQIRISMDFAEQARVIIYNVAQKTQESLILNIESIVTTALQSVFGEDSYEFKVDFNIKRNRTEADLYFVKDGFRYNPMSGSGYGAVDIASFALRIVALELSQPRVRKVLIIDEPFKNLSEEYHDLAGQMIRELSEKLGIQFIIVTHIKELGDHAHKVFTVVRNGKISKIKEM
jgi:DNA repair exonuclease SbcCD ATPase subunit